MSGNKILILEDDETMASELKLFLKIQGYECDTINDGLLLFEQDLKKYCVFILDINVPTINGIDVCKMLRENDKLTPILMLTAYSDVSNKVTALDNGADDYLVKPFHFDELLARLKALLRRSATVESEADVVHTVEDLVLNTADMTVSRGGKAISLTPKEYKLLELLVLSKGQTLSKQFITSKVWDLNFETGTNTIEVYINFLRSKIDKGFDVKLIHTRPGYGYFLKRID
jgi:DNA-binding response OmpR family regulator